jgi:hypothetical protein
MQDGMGKLSQDILFHWSALVSEGFAAGNIQASHQPSIEKGDPHACSTPALPLHGSLTQTIWTNGNNKGCWLVWLGGRGIIGLGRLRIVGLLILRTFPPFIRNHSLWSDSEFSFLKVAFGYGAILRAYISWENNTRSPSQDFSSFYGTWSWIPWSLEPATCLYSEPDESS